MERTRSKYSELLRDPRWQKKRLEIMQRDNFTCQMCGDTKTTLNVHHLEYTPGNKPWDEPNEILITFCEDCHFLVSNGIESYYKVLSKEKISKNITRYVLIIPFEISIIEREFNEIRHIIHFSDQKIGLYNAYMKKWKESPIQGVDSIYHTLTNIVNGTH